MNRKQKKILVRIIITIILAAVLQFIPAAGLPRLIAYVIIYALIGYDIVIKAARGIVNGRVMDENFLMTIATLGALFLGAWSGSGDYTEAVAVMLFYQIGELFQSCAVGRSRRNISALMDIRPDYANIEEDGHLTRVDPDEVAVGTVIVVQPGEKVPIDGIVTGGTSGLNTAALTGESLPRSVSVGDEIYSGSININSVLRVRTTRLFGESTASRILDLVENASSNKSRTENFISRFAAVYTPAVCIAALLLAVGIPCIRLIAGTGADWKLWIYRGLSFLVVSCPCAFVVSIPLSFFAGLGCAGREGILIKGSNYLEALSKVTCMVFDKTGTLTKGVFEVTDVHTVDMSADKLIEYAALCECASTHPISRSLQQAYGRDIDRSRVTDIEETSGYGVTAGVDGIAVAVGSGRLMDRLGISYEEKRGAGTVCYVAVDGRYAGCIEIADVIKFSSVQAIKELRAAGVRKTVMLTGDVKDTADAAGAALGIDEIYSGLLPGRKVEIVEALLAGLQGREKLAFAGDGINDAPVLARADIGIAMGALGSDAAIEAADVVLMDDDPMQIVKAKKISARCIGIVYQNIIFSLAVKFACLILVAAGAADMWAAIFADVGVMVLAVLNAIRALKYR